MKCHTIDDIQLSRKPPQTQHSSIGHNTCCTQKPNQCLNVPGLTEYCVWQNSPQRCREIEKSYERSIPSLIYTKKPNQHLNVRESNSLTKFTALIPKYIYHGNLINAAYLHRYKQKYNHHQCMSIFNRIRSLMKFRDNNSSIQNIFDTCMRTLDR